MAAPRLWRVIVRDADGHRRTARHVVEDIDQVDRFREHLLAIARGEDPLRTDSGEGWIADYELEVVDPDEPGRGPVRVLRWGRP